MYNRLRKNVLQILKIIIFNQERKDNQHHHPTKNGNKTTNQYISDRVNLRSSLAAARYAKKTECPIPPESKNTEYQIHPEPRKSEYQLLPLPDRPDRGNLHSSDLRSSRKDSIVNAAIIQMLIGTGGVRTDFVLKSELRRGVVFIIGGCSASSIMAPDVTFGAIHIPLIPPPIAPAGFSFEKYGNETTRGCDGVG